MGFAFDGVYSGFLGSEKQIDIVKELIVSQNSSFVLIDPVMGDNGTIYKTYTEAMCSKMKELVSLATVTTPNITEACILLGKQYKNGEYSLEEIEEGQLIPSNKDINLKKKKRSGTMQWMIEAIKSAGIGEEQNESVEVVLKNYIKQCANELNT